MTAHVVLFQPKPGIDPTDRAAFAVALSRACREIPSVRRAVVGKSSEFDAGYARSFGESAYAFAAVFEFDDHHGLVEYLTHPYHRELGRLFWRLCERTAIVEVELEDAKTADLEALLR
jgi:Stress responsive A/B Barrel Domain